MKKISISISGKRYEVKLEDDFADYVSRDMVETGISLEKDNDPSTLLKAYLRLAHKNSHYEDEIELLIETLDSF